MESNNVTFALHLYVDIIGAAHRRVPFSNVHAAYTGHWDAMKAIAEDKCVTSDRAKENCAVHNSPTNSDTSELYGRRTGPIGWSAGQRERALSPL